MSRSSRIWLITIAMTALVAAAIPSAAQGHTSAAAYSTGTYSGKIVQLVPKPYTGAVSLVVTHGKIIGLTLNFGVACQDLGWVRDHDPIPTFTVGIASTGGFSYVGEVGDRHLRLSGIFRGHTVVGSFFQSFWLGHDFCTMNRPAVYTASS